MKIKSGIYDVLYSGTVVGIIGEPIEFQFPEHHSSLKLIINFRDDEKVKDPNMEFGFPEDKTMTITLVNAKTNLGVGNVELLHLGHLENRKLYLNYRVYSVNELSKSINYTFYLGEEVEDGK
ncbi:DUF6864 domain-containing function [Tenacibaculum aquimarinum]|uniref:DUF6864 domain-containing function n=1 Tax=Tenacibaculum aquimarinum TaxID=2910675 RepID=UPI001F0ACB37|nr:hypothetical protein [Tenacibaculum aquimarinum]MCH3883222.1 hypothetical protein [Tenacibaculum aquimarinum]